MERIFRSTRVYSTKTENLKNKVCKKRPGQKLQISGTRILSNFEPLFMRCHVWKLLIPCCKFFRNELSWFSVSASLQPNQLSLNKVNYTRILANYLSHEPVKWRKWKLRLLPISRYENDGNWCIFRTTVSVAFFFGGINIYIIIQLQ